jgi:hypothetical protein
MKKNIAFLFIAVLAVTLAIVLKLNLFSSVTLANNYNNTHLLHGACDDENYVYYIGKDYRIMRISKETEMVADMGVSTNFLSALSIIDGYLYVNATEYSGDVGLIRPCKINLNEITDITYFDYEKTRISSVDAPILLIGDMIYFINGNNSKINRNGTNGTAIEDIYFQILGTENNIIYAYIPEEKNITENGITKTMCWIHELTPDLKSKKKLFQLSFNSEGWRTFSTIFRGYIYISEFNSYDPDSGIGIFQIYRHPLTANSKKEILFEHINYFSRILAVTEDGVYFYYDYPGEDEYAANTSNIYRMNHDGTDTKELPYKYDIHNSEENGYYYVSSIDGKLYGIINNKIILVEYNHK